MWQRLSLSMKCVAVLAVVAGCLWAVLGIQSCADRRVATVASAQADQKAKIAAADAAQGASHGQDAQALQPRIDQDEARIRDDEAGNARRDAKVAQLRKTQPSPVRPPSVPGSPDPDPVAPPLVSPLDAAKDDLIAGLKQENADLKTEIVDLKAQNTALDLEAHSYKAAAENSAAADNLRHIALDAQMAAVKSSQNMGRLEGGGAVGLLWAAARILGHI